jgi:hypothetical protein
MQRGIPPVYKERKKDILDNADIKAQNKAYDYLRT